MSGRFNNLSPPRTQGYNSPGRGSMNGSYKSQAVGPAGKLEHVAERFSTFYNDLEQEKQQRKTVEVTRNNIMQESLLKMEKSLDAEIKRRAEADKQIQTHFETEIRGLQERSATQFQELQTALKASVDGLSRTVQDLHAIIKDERESRRLDIEHLAQSLVGKVNECVGALDEERLARMEMEGKTLKQVGNDIFRLQDKLEQERALRDSDISALRAEVHEVIGNRNGSDDKFQELVVEQLQDIKAGLQLEREERISEDDEIVQAVNDYTRALQDGLKLINRTE